MLAGKTILFLEGDVAAHTGFGQDWPAGEPNIEAAARALLAKLEYQGGNDSQEKNAK